jgi:hypothetical protein
MLLILTMNLLFKPFENDFIIWKLIFNFIGEQAQMPKKMMKTQMLLTPSVNLYGRSFI